MQNAPLPLGKYVDRPSRLIAHYESLVETGRMTMAVAASEFGSLLGSGVKSMMEAGVKSTPAVWPQIARTVPSDKAWERYTGTSIPTGMKAVQPGEEAPDMAFGSDTTILINQRYAGKLVIPKELLDDDQTGEIQRRVSGIGEAAVVLKDTTVANILNNGNATACYDGSNLFATTHPNMTGGTALSANNNYPNTGAATEANMETLFAALQLWQDYTGLPTILGIRYLLSGVTQWTNILRLVHSQGTQASLAATPLSSAVTNVFQNIGTPLLWKRLTVSSWYIITDVMGLLMQQREALSVAQENVLSGQSLLANAYTYRIQERYRAGAVNFRLGMRCMA